MKTKLLLLSFLAVCLLALAPSAGYAQKLLDYTVEKTYEQPYQQISGNLLAQNIYGWSYWWLYETDARLGGFQFKYDDRMWNRFGIGGGGYVALFNSTMPFPYTCGQYSYPYTWICYYFYDAHTIYNNMCANRPALYPMYAYYGSYYTATYPGQIYFEVRGTAPDRILIVEWRNVSPYDANNWPSSAYRNFQCWMHESGIVEYKYGPMYFPSNYSFDYYYYPPYWYGYAWFTVGYTGCDWVTSQDGLYSYYSYINIYSRDGGQELVPHYSNKNYLPFYATPAIRDISTGFPTAADVATLRPGLVITLSAYPSLVNADPKDVILKRGYVYTDDLSVNPAQLNHPAVYFNRNNADDLFVRAKYRIEGPLPKNNPDYKTIYVACESGNPNDEIIDWARADQPVGKNIRRKMPSGKGLAARASDGALDLQTNATSIPGGEYLVKTELVLNNDRGEPFYTQAGPNRNFYIALDNDIAIVNVKAPKLGYKYPFGEQMPFEVEVRNIGVNPVYGFTLTYRLTDPNGSVTTMTQSWSSANPLTTGQSVSIAFPRRIPLIAGEWTIVYDVTLEGNRDDDLKNNRWPRSADDKHFFLVAHEIEAAAMQILHPNSDHPVDKPIPVRARFINNGVSDISNAPVRARIFNMANPNVILANLTGSMPDIPSGNFNTAVFQFPVEWIPTVPGIYGVCVSVNINDDPITSNNEICTTFTVIEGLRGTYTIGYQNEGQLRNFTTLKRAADAMYKWGIDGSIVFELTDASYETGSRPGDLDFNPHAPALDLSSKIIGVDRNNTITFKPSQTREAMPGGISINLYSEEGIGLFFGQNVEPSNINAVVNDIPRQRQRFYANTEGYITFDGGPYKAFRFKLHTNSNFRAPVYLGTGAQNITIKNCRIENGDPSNVSMHHILPLMIFDQDLGRFRFETNLRNDGKTFTAGILLRSTAPFDGRLSTENLIFLDTIMNNNNKIMNNDISGFGYGIVSLGAGPLFKYLSNLFYPYYNDNNIISGNKIWNVARAGIFAGFTKNTKISNNRIYNVVGVNDFDAAGIILGGEWRRDWLGYNNFDLTVDGNEVSNINGVNGVYGIKIEQDRMALPATAGGYVYFPSGDENMIISNNVVWSLSPGNASTHKIGISAMTSRIRTADPAFNYLNGIHKDYLMGSLKIGNNTILIGNDQYANTGTVAGVMIQQARMAHLYNNAIAFEDNNLSTNFAGALFYNGALPKDGGLKADRNAYWLGNSSAPLYRFVEKDAQNNTIDLGALSDYKILDQWRLWTGQEKNSSFGDFTKDLTYIGQNPMRLRVNTTPQPPIGSILNNRGENLSWVKFDIDSRARGSSGQRYDIGAFEFDGRIHVNDLDVVGLYEPGSYKQETGEFSDAEYFMTREPVTVSARIRNNGSMTQSNVEVKVDLYLQLPDGSFSATPDFTDRELIEVIVGESYDVVFDLIGIAGERYQFKTYGDLRGQGYSVPAKFATMEANVTPIYRMVVTLQYDQNNANNVLDKKVRLYLARSNMGLLVSAENSHANIAGGSPTVDHIAGKLNYEKVVEGLGKLGWQVNIPEKIYDYDVFERNSWDPKSVNYSIYRSLIWSDADDKALTRYQRLDLNKFLQQMQEKEKKNLLIASQEMARANTPIDAKFVTDVLRVINVAPGNPMGANVSNDGNVLYGVGLAKGSSQNVVSTKYKINTPTGEVTDTEPFCALVSVNEKGEGLSREAFTYKNHPASAKDSVMGGALTTLTRNIVYLGTDWRHFGNIELIVRAIIDFVEANGGVIVAAELLDFNARQSGEKVEVTWATASELNSARFDVERAEVRSAGTSEFTKIDELAGAGTSSTLRNYGPVIDRNVTLGNTYVYRLKMVDRDGAFEYSPERIVTLTGEGIVKLNNAKPNPATDETVIEYSLIEAANLKIALYDAAGKMVKALFDGSQKAGNNELRINVKDIPSGTYTVVFTAGNITLTRSITVIK